MSGRESRTNNLIGPGSFSKMEPYFSKKTSVMVLLAKILYGVVIFVLFGFGVYFLYMSKQDEINQDLIDFNKKSGEWNTTEERSSFMQWDISILNSKNKTEYLKNDFEKMHKYDDNEKLYYDAVQKTSKNIASLISNIKLTKHKSDASSLSYNLTANFTIELNNTYSKKQIQVNDIDIFIRAPSPHMKQSECVKNKGIWIYDDETCYKYYMLRTLCLILDYKTQELFHDYKHFKCNGFNEWYESFSIFPWLIPTYDPTFDDLEAVNKKIGIYLSTDKDPYVWANYNGTLHFSNLAESYSVAGVWLITCAIALVIIPLLVYFKDNTISEVSAMELKEEEAYQLKVPNARNVNPALF